MAETTNSYYDKLTEGMGSKTDSVFEPCRVVSFDPKTLLATVYGIRTKQMKKNVVVLFPSLFLNTGIISFPVKNSTGLIFVGADNESYMVSGQYTLPSKEAENSVMKSNAAPSQYDELLSLENIEPGEHLIRSLGGAQVYARNTGEVEIATGKMHRLSLNELEGTLEQVFERIKENIGYSEKFDGTYDPINSDDSDEHHIYEKLFEKVPDWETDEVIDEGTLRQLIQKASNPEEFFPLRIEPMIAHTQKVNVYEEGTDKKKKSKVDLADLFYDFVLLKKDSPEAEVAHERFRMNLSKEGSLELISYYQDAVNAFKIEYSRNHLDLYLHDKNGMENIIYMDPNYSMLEYRSGSYRTQLHLQAEGIRMFHTDGIESTVSYVSAIGPFTPNTSRVSRKVDTGSGRVASRTVQMHASEEPQEKKELIDYPVLIQQLLERVVTLEDEVRTLRERVDGS